MVVVIGTGETRQVTVRRIGAALPRVIASRGYSPPSAMYSCGRCPSGPFSADMTRAEAYRHAAATHNAVIRNPRMLALR